jgi:tetratricopeptide (TPR) repeat protein
MDLLSINSDNIFVNTAQQQAQLEEMANRALSSGIDLYMQGNYKKAVKEFQRSVGLAPYGQYSGDATNYMANAYLKLNRTEKAIKTYQKSIDLNPNREDTYIALGNLYFSLGRPKEAEGLYKKLVRINPSDNNHYALGQAYLELEQFSDAEKQFNIVKRLSPTKPNGDFGLGLVASKRGNYEKALRFFDAALDRDKAFYDAYAEKGYVYADMGRIEDAEEIIDLLENKSPVLGEILNQYVYEAKPPKIAFAYSTDFMHRQSMNTQVASLDLYLADANASKTFTMKFTFDKQMDRESVENVLNWKIKRTSGGGPTEMYNFGLPIADTEVDISLRPDHVYYDDKDLMAVVYFTIQQNETADGTIDPSHIEFTFSGKDQFGLKMDSAADQFTGFSGIV